MSIGGGLTRHTSLCVNIYFYLGLYTKKTVTLNTLVTMTVEYRT